MGLTELIPIYKKEKADIDDSVLLIRINKYYHYGMTERELYDATRGVWKIGENRDNAKYAFAVYGGIVREVIKLGNGFLQEQPSVPEAILLMTLVGSCGRGGRGEN